MHKLFHDARRAAIIVPAALLTLACSFAISAQPSSGPRAELRDLPLVELPAVDGAHALAIILSGDGGWRAIEQRMASGLTQAKIGVVGLDSLQYFWGAKTPEIVAKDLDRIIAAYMEEWRVADVLLVGYSFGADVLPAVVNRMDSGAREHLVQISVLGLAKDALFEFHVGNWLGIGSSGQPIQPEAEQLDMKKVQCIYGESERDSLCRDPVFRDAELIETPGGHHFGGDYEGLAQRLLAGYRARS